MLHLRFWPLLLVAALPFSSRCATDSHAGIVQTSPSHQKTKPDYATVFPQQTVNRIDIVMEAAQWDSVRTNMKSLFGCDFGENTGGMGPTTKSEARYVPVTIRFNDETWNQVGFRLKGNSSLSQAWREGNYKLPFKLSFDHFKDVDSTLKGQRFYGFEELSFSPSFKDQSLIREKMTSDLFRLAGVPAAQTAFCRIYIDRGNGPEYCGLYTMVELPDDSMIKTQFGSKNGNIYKPESSFASFSTNEFKKMNNKKAADFSDAQAFVEILNSKVRKKDPEKWRNSLEQVFNVKEFLRYLAVNNAIVNWDSYGNMGHNFYLYNDSVHKLTWIPWDHNEALNGNPGVNGTTRTFDGMPGRQGGGQGMPQGGPGGGMPGGGPGGMPPGGMGMPGGGMPGGFGQENTAQSGENPTRSNQKGMPQGGPGGPGGQMGLSLSMNEITKAWPLINYLISDPVYAALYKTELTRFYNSVFTQEYMDKMIDRYVALITPYVTGTEKELARHTYLTSSTSFDTAVQDLKTHVKNRRITIAEFLR